MLKQIPFEITEILLNTSKTPEHQTKLIIYAILIMIFLGFSLMFGYLFHKLRDENSPKIKTTNKNIKKFLIENRKKILGSFCVIFFVITLGILSLMIPLI